MHFTPNKIEKTHELKKYDWQKPHQSNLTGTEKAYYPNKDKDGIKKKYSSWKQ
jgi:NADH dehydrogenase